jgi:alkanesulfonate monooxygenase SsuD/methylene tetrahydromethanopterin reductase-like flavin-dependent oxidoreductase (luciferase family)
MIRVDPRKIREQRLAESIEIIRQLLDGERVDFQGDHYSVAGAQIEPSLQDRLPILIGGNGKALLQHAGAHADIVGFQGLGRTRKDGHRHTVKWDPDWLTTQVEQFETVVSIGSSSWS